MTTRRLGVVNPQHTNNMPCSDGGVPYAEDNRERNRLKNRLDTATHLLCSLCNNLVKNGRQANINAVPHLADWWSEHKAEDARREAQERAECEEKRQIKAALAKLSSRERQLLRQKNAL